MVETRTATSQIEAENIHMLMIMNGDIKTELYQGGKLNMIWLPSSVMNDLMNLEIDAEIESLSLYGV